MQRLIIDYYEDNNEELPKWTRRQLREDVREFLIMFGDLLSTFEIGPTSLAAMYSAWSGRKITKKFFCINDQHKDRYNNLYEAGFTLIKGKLAPLTKAETPTPDEASIDEVGVIGEKYQNSKEKTDASTATYDERLNRHEELLTSLSSSVKRVNGVLNDILKSVRDH